MCLKRVAELMWQLQFFAAAARSKWSNERAKEPRVTHATILQMHIWKFGSVAAVARVSPSSPSKRALGHSRAWTHPAVTDILDPLSRVPAIAMFFGGYLSILSPPPSLSVSSQQHNRTVVSSYGVLLGALVSDWHVVRWCRGPAGPSVPS